MPDWGSELHWGAVADWAVAIATGALFVVTFMALKTWRHEIKYRDRRDAALTMRKQTASLESRLTHLGLAHQLYRRVHETQPYDIYKSLPICQDIYKHLTRSLQNTN
jgi:hypothetical protein